MATKRVDLSFSTTTFPLRLIDLSATLASHTGGVHFAAPADWSFHVISHTWSEDIRKLSIRVGKILEKEEQSGSARRYNDCFADAGFAGEAHYESLRDFLRVLAADGVEKVWFDALCINQTDANEKEREICNMGAYYYLSAGCYVVTHGIGTDAGFKALNSNGEVPRWFTRVWTYQEGVLPPKLMFIVERFDEQTRSCLADNPSYFETELMWVDWDEELGDESNYTKSETYYRRKIASRGSEWDQLYVLGAQAYWRMMTGALLVRKMVLKDVPKSRLDEFHRAFGQLGETAEYMIDVEAAVRAIRLRECTVEEDRVLGMLGLFGFTGELQLRSKQTLRQQMLWLARTLLAQRPERLVNLCAADFEGNHDLPGASWLPDLRLKEVMSRFERPLTGFGTSLDVVKTHSARVVELMEDGRAVMSARGVRGCSLVRLPLQRLSEKDRRKYGADYDDPRFRLEVDDDPSFYINFCYFNGEEHQAGPMCIGVEGDDPLTLRGGLSIHAPPSIHKLGHYNHPNPYTICQTILLLLGHNEAGRCVVMLCLTGTYHHSQYLHKIGIIHADANLNEMLVGRFSPTPLHYTLGSFGNNLTPFLSIECQEILQKLTTNN